ncbi:TonB-dependent receptor domain-containing protein, partial [Thermaurantiacus sp.]
MDLVPPEILVTGTALEAPALPLGEIRLDAAALATPAGRVEAALARVPGLSTFRRASSASASPTAQGVTLRALGGNAASRVVLTLDGIPQADLFAGWIATAALDAAPLAAARITRGGGSVSEGPGALTGAIALDSGPPSTFTAVRGGSFASLDLAGGAALPVAGGGAFGLAGRLRRSNGFLLVAADRAGSVDVPARSRQWGLRGRALASLGSATELQASLAAFADSRLRGLEGADTRTSGGDLGLRLVHRGPIPAEVLLYGQLRDFMAKNLALNSSRTVATLTLDQFATPASGVGGRIEIRPLPFLRVGGDWRFAQGTTRERFRFVAGSPTAFRTAGGTSASGGGFAELSWAPMPGLELSAGGRVDRWSLSDGRLFEGDLVTGAVIRNEAAPDRRGTEPSWRAGARWSAPSSPLALRLAGYSGWRLPTLNELHRPFRAGQDATAANPLLRPERLTGVEGGMDLGRPEGPRLAVTGFANRLEGAIANVTRGRGPGNFPGVGFIGPGGVFRQRLNLPAIEASGVEADLSLDRGPFHLEAGVAFVDATVDGGAVA